MYQCDCVFCSLCFQALAKYMKIARATKKGRAEVREVNKAVMVRTPNDLVCVYLNLFVDSSRPHEV